MYKKVNPDMDFATRELEIIEFWNREKIFEKSIEKNSGNKEFSFYDGPPTANGKPHIGHILTRVMKDIIPRFKTMKGYHVRRKAGWDTHGLPVELEVEKALGINGKQDIEKYGIRPFIEKCKESVWKYKKDWEDMSERVGYWVDMENPYVTYEDNYIESVWWSLKQIFDRGLIYKGHKIVPYCPRCGTALSSHEVAQGYKDVEENTAIVKFRVSGTNDTYFLAWTTTPWTLPSNVALCMGAEYDYSVIEAGGEKYILAAELVSKYFEDFKIIETRKGKTFERQKYEPMFDFFKTKEESHFITNDGYVTLTDGTGIVHIAPAYGEDDARVGKSYGLPFVQAVNEQGKFAAECGELAGLFCKDADKLILKQLEKKNLLYKVFAHTHSYPFCWRCDTPLLYYARNTWFIKMSEFRRELLQNNSSVNWMPESIGRGRMANFLENVIDWGLSRERYWGTPLPVWVCDKCGHQHAVGSKAELKELGGIKGDIELHKPYVDEVKIKCKCGGIMKRTPEVIDCWYDSGAMPFAQYHYPFENQDIFEKTFPAAFISEAVDQTRGWFYTLLAISTLLFEKSPFENCIVLGHVNDKFGQKMSKHKGNVIDSKEVLDKQGADAVRWYFYTSSAPWLPSRFSMEAVSEAQRKFLGTLWNTYSFYVLYAEIDKFDPGKYALGKCRLTLMDKWILSSLHSLVDLVDKNLEEYKITESARAIADFTDSLSNWYIRRCRERYWVSGMPEDKISAYMTLNHVLVTLSGLCAPYTPFVAEMIYQNIVKSVDEKAQESVHLCEFPVSQKNYIDKKLEAGMAVVLNIAGLGRAARNNGNIKNRQPLSELLLCGENLTQLSAELKQVICDELNVKKLTVISDANEYISYDVKPQLKTLGPKYGAKINAVRELLKRESERAFLDTRDGGVFKADADGTAVELTAEDILVSYINKEGFCAESGKGMTVVLKTALTPELIEEGLMRELVSKIQTMRKDSGFEVTDHIVIGYEDKSGAVSEVFNRLKKEIMEDTLADGIETRAENGREWNINGHDILLSVKKI